MKRVTPAISKGIAENKDTMIDALYPIMGGMISKYVTQAIKELMETINHKIESGLSFSRYKRKLKSKITGVSETELLLEESSDALISGLFIIQKESGLLISEAQLKDKEIDDPHMVASMASAIKDFINDWIQSNETQSEVQILSYGNATLYIESAGSVYIIAFLDSEPDFEQRTNINAYFSKIVKEYADFFQKFDGDDSSEEAKMLSTQMNVYLNEQNSVSKVKKDKKNPAKYILLILLLLLTGYAVTLLNKQYLEYTLEEKIKNQTGQVIHIEKEKDRIILNGHVESYKKVNDIEQIIYALDKRKIENNLLVSIKEIEKMIEKDEKKNLSSLTGINDKLLILEKEFSSSVDTLNDKVLFFQNKLKETEVDLLSQIKKRTNEVETLQKEKQYLSKVIHVEEEITSRMNEAFNKSDYYNVKDKTLSFENLNLFDPGEMQYNSEAIDTLSESFETYMKILVDYKEYIDSIIIEGHTDSSGMEDDNIQLSKKRASAVKFYLLRLRIVKQYYMTNMIVSKGFGSQQAIVRNGIEDKNASRRIIIRFELKNSQILNNAKKIFND